MSQSRERVANIFHLFVDLLVAGAAITTMAGMLVAGQVVETGASILYARRRRRTAVGTRRGSTETEPLGAED